MATRNPKLPERKRTYNREYMREYRRQVPQKKRPEKLTITLPYDFVLGDDVYLGNGRFSHGRIVSLEDLGTKVKIVIARVLDEEP